MEKLSVRDLEVKGRRVLVRVDFNVPTEESDGNTRITDDTRIRESLPTIELLRAKGAKVILLAHFGRPKGKPNLQYSLRPVADHLTKMIPPPVHFSPEVIGPSTETVSKALPDSGVLLVENVRFFSEEEANADIGGGDSVTAVKQFGIAGKMTFISTGGGASLELLEGKELPGVAALTDR
jgi:phosphoglycerate kinase